MKQGLIFAVLATALVAGGEAIARDGDQPRLRFSTDSPLRTTTGDLEAMALYAGEGAGAIDAVVPAADRVKAIVEGARRILASAP